MRLVLPFLLFAAVALTVLADPATPAIAIINTPETADLGALLTTEFSSDPQVRLVDRADLTKIGDEAKVQQMAGNDAMALGKMAHADGLLFLDHRADGTHVRFTAVNLGYALFDDLVPDGNDPVQQAKVIAHLVLNDALKLNLDPSKAVPLSILNLRADYGTPESQRLERNLTLLLESRLAAVPEFVVLERRHAWSLNFEHSLSPEANPVLRGACLVDGSFNVNGDDCTISLRVRKSGDAIGQTVTVQGKASDENALADRLLAAIQKSLNHDTPVSPPVGGDAEAQEYLAEALWAWRAHVPDAAREAVDSAELLDAPPEFVLPLRIQILCDLADQKMEQWLPPFDPANPTFTPDALAEKVSILKDAIADAVRYRDEKLEDKLGQFVPSNGSERYDFRTAVTIARVTVISSKILFLLDQDSAPQGDDLRHELRRITGYDPLHGQTGLIQNYFMSNNANAADVFSDDWAQSPEEEAAWLRLECRDSVQILPRYSIDNPAKRFCTRFIPNPADREKKFDDFVESLEHDPGAQRTYFVLKTHEGDPAVAKEAFSGYIAALLPHQDEIAASEDYSPLVESIWYLGPVAQEDPSAALPLVHAVLDAPQPGEAGIIVLRNLWHAADTPTDQAAPIWKEEQAYEKRWTAVPLHQERRQEGSFLSQMDSVMSAFKSKYPDVIAATASDNTTATDALGVTRFWYPWKTPDVPPQCNIIINGVSAGDNDTLWISAYLMKLEKTGIFKVHLPDLATSTLNLDGISPEGMFWTPQALYVPIHNRDAAPGPGFRDLWRYNFSTSAWEKRTLPVSFDGPHAAWIDGSIYLATIAGGPGFGDREVGLAKYDWDEDKLTVLAENRRRPAQNQFDDTAPYRITAIFAGPGNRPAMTTDTGTYYIQEAPGTWPPIFDGRFNDFVVTEEGRSLVFNDEGEATYIDPQATAPVPWMAADKPIYRRAKGLPGVAGPVTTPWTKDAIWDCPPGKRKSMSPGSIAFRDGRFFILNQPTPLDGRFELLCYDRATGRTPRHIPLSFQVSAADKPALSLHPGNFPNGFRLDQLEHPHSPFLLRVTGTAQGLCLVIDEAGFWFIPYSDIDAYLKNHLQVMGE